MKIAIAGATGAVGTHVTEVARARGHDVVAMSRASGQDLASGAGLADAIRGADAVIDVASVATVSATTSRAFFDAATANLLAAEHDAGVTHHVALSIVGIDGVDDGYYAGKLVQERIVASAGTGWSILRASQFHEFVGQTLGQATFGPIALAPRARIRPVAAREVAAELVTIAEGSPIGRARDLVGPRDETLADLGRRLLRHDGIRRAVVPVPLPGAFGKALRSGVLRGDGQARSGTLTFDTWLDAPERRR